MARPPYKAVTDEHGKRVLTPQPPKEAPVQTGDFMTEKGKNVLIEKDPQGYGMWIIKFPDGGIMPESLRGMFTNHEEASKVIKKWLEARAA